MMHFPFSLFFFLFRVGEGTYIRGRSLKRSKAGNWDDRRQETIRRRKTSEGMVATAYYHGGAGNGRFGRGRFYSYFFFWTGFGFGILFMCAVWRDSCFFPPSPKAPLSFLLWIPTFLFSFVAFEFARTDRTRRGWDPRRWGGANCVVDHLLFMSCIVFVAISRVTP